MGGDRATVTTMGARLAVLAAPTLLSRSQTLD